PEKRQPGVHRHGQKIRGAKAGKKESVRKGVDAGLEFHLPVATKQDKTAGTFPPGMDGVLPRRKGYKIGTVRLGPGMGTGPVLKFIAVLHGDCSFYRLIGLFGSDRAYYMPKSRGSTRAVPARRLSRTEGRNVCRRRSPLPRYPWCRRPPRCGGGRCARRGRCAC